MFLLLQKDENNTCLKCINWHFCRRSSVFENERNGLESRQFGGVLGDKFLRENDKINES